jgi:4-amino-4-deoxy-L-arabinose transferase-like glycosyltransferase
MARVGHWIQSGTVAFYPTVILRQIYNPPLSEYAIMHFQLLAGSDCFANLVQWFAFVACGAAISLIVKELGLETRFQVFAMLLGATIPAAIVQSTSTQNDLFAAFFVLAFFYFFIRAAETNSWADFLWTGTALGLAILAKGSAYFFCFPIGLYFVVVHFLTLKEKRGKLRFVKQVAALLLIALAFNFAHYARSTTLFGEPVSTGAEKIRNENLTARIALANLVRNYANHLGSRSETLNAAIEDSVESLLGDELKNPDSTWLPQDFPFDVTSLTHEDRAGNLVHVLLITIVLSLIFLIRGDERRYLYGAVFAIVFGYVLFSLLLKWQVWGSRLQLPLFMLGTCLVAAFIGRVAPRAAILTAVLCFTTALPFLFYSAPRRVLSDDNQFVLSEPREAKYFKNLPDLEPLYTEAARFIRQQPAMPGEIGIYIEYNEFEYPLWILLKEDFAEKPILRHVGVANVSRKLAAARPLPEYVISTRSETTIESVEYAVVWSKDIVKVLRKKEAAAP